MIFCRKHKAGYCKKSFKVDPDKMEERGPIVDIAIGYPATQIWQPEQMNTERPKRGFKALIDTGTSITIVSEQIVSEMVFKANGFLPTATLNGIVRRPTYYVRVALQDGIGYDIKVLAAPIPYPVDAIIGRDIMRLWRSFYYDGKKGKIFINF